MTIAIEQIRGRAERGAAHRVIARFQKSDFWEGL